MKNLNERQSKLITELQDAFGKMNGSTTAKGRLLDIQAIRNMMDESEAIKREVELYNDIITKEFYWEWTTQLEQLTADLEELGLVVTWKDDGNSTEIFVEHMKRDAETLKTFTTYEIGIRMRFYITIHVDYSSVQLPNGGRISKAIGFRYQLHDEWYSTIEKLIESSLFECMLNQSLIENNKSKTTN